MNEPVLSDKTGVEEIIQAFEVELMTDFSRVSEIAEKVDDLFCTIVNAGKTDDNEYRNADNAYIALTSRLPSLLWSEHKESHAMQSLVTHLVLYRYLTFDTRTVAAENLRDLDQAIFLAIELLGQGTTYNLGRDDIETSNTAFTQNKNKRVRRFTDSLLSELAAADETAYSEMVESMLVDYYGFGKGNNESSRLKAEKIISIWENASGAEVRITTASGERPPTKEEIADKKRAYVAYNLNYLARLKTEGLLPEVHTLNSVCNITCFSRYSLSQLKDLHDTLINGYQTGDITALVYSAQTDWNGAMLEHSDIENYSDRKLETIIIEANTMLDILKFTLKASRFHQKVKQGEQFIHPYDFILLSAHGSGNNLTFGKALDSRSVAVNDLSRRIFESLFVESEEEDDAEESPTTIFDSEFSINEFIANSEVLQQALKRYRLLKPETQLGLHSCSTNKRGGSTLTANPYTGEPFRFTGENIAQVLSQALQLPDGIAPETPITTGEAFLITRGQRLGVSGGTDALKVSTIKPN